VILKVYNTMGQEVAVLVDKKQPAGFHQLHWDGRDSNGNAVSTGLYVYKIIAKNFSQTRKLLLLN
jgi:flagellar hook assembly protein FlgD